MKLFRPTFVFRIERARAGQYANSPSIWSLCGYIRAVDRGSAEKQAAHAVGSSRVRVIPEEPN